MMDQRISLITLGVRDIIRSAGFYESLGWCRVDSPDGVVVFDLLGQTLGLYPRENLANDLGLDPAQIGGFLGITLGYNVREKPEVAAILAKVEPAGGRVLKPASDVFWGGHHGFFTDPDAHVWEVAFNPFSPLAANGAFQWNGAASGETPP